MLAEHSALLRRVAIGGDLLVVAGSFLLAYVLRDRMPLGGRGPLLPFVEYLWLLAVTLAIWPWALKRFGFYGSFRYRPRAQLLANLVKVQAVGALLLMSVLFVAARWEVSRLLMQFFVLISFVALATEKITVMSVLRRWRRQGHNIRHTLIVGTADRAGRYLEFLQQHPYWGVRVIGVVDDGAADPDGEIAGVPIVGRLKDLPEIVRHQPTDEVVFAISGREFPQVEEHLDLCQEIGIAARLVIDLPRRRWMHQDLAWVDGVGILSLDPVRRSPWALAVKRTMDVAGALIGLAVFLVVYVLYASRIRRDSLGPVLFSQVRVGRNRRLFALYKFRTMYVDAEARQAEFHAANEMQGAMFKLRDDPRVTPLGKWLRARHLDELPQFWNVLRGDMSLVGTRPPTLDEVECYRPHHRRRLSMKPGITGLWQLAGNKEISDFEEIVKLDCRYIDSWSIWLDLRILGRTVLKVMRRSGW